ncbi:MAG: glycerol-3-phosphate 1-O-acyltransferase PlsY [Chitinophagaceae bacterium]|nr:glycerol-3-phosphate 1-O-acyltransferase PlsY [Chitinophagaceae bacterium]
MNYEIIVAFILAYLIGAIPFSVWTGMLFYHKDVRKYGSGNAGATNTFRVLGTQAGIIVLFLDIVKGSIAVSLAYYLGNLHFESDNFIYYELGLGITAAIGHIFPVYLNFKGGKGVATLFGAGLSVFPVAALVCVAVFLVVFLTTRYVSLGSIIASVVFPIVIIFYNQITQWPIILFSVFIPCIIIYTHRKNIQRLLKGEESKIIFEKN